MLESQKTEWLWSEIVVDQNDNVYNSLIIVNIIYIAIYPINRHTWPYALSI